MERPYILHMFTPGRQMSPFDINMAADAGYQIIVPYAEAGLDAVTGTTVTLNAVNNVDNANVYTPPFDPGSTRNGAQDLTRREQSLALEFTKLRPGDSLEVFKTFSLDENYSRYQNLRFWVAGIEISRFDPLTGSLFPYVPATDSLYYFVRFASDERKHIRCSARSASGVLCLGAQPSREPA